MLAEQPAGHVTTPIMPARPLCFGSAARNFPMCDVCRYEDLCYATWESMYLWTDHESKSALLRVYARENHELRRRCTFAYSEWSREEKVRERCVGINAGLRDEIKALRAEITRLKAHGIECMRRAEEAEKERDVLARAVAAWGPHHCVCPKFRNTMAGQERLPHLPGCPVALAEKIVKEAGDGR